MSKVAVLGPSSRAIRAPGRTRPCRRRPHRDTAEPGLAGRGVADVHLAHLTVADLQQPVAAGVNNVCSAVRRDGHVVGRADFADSAGPGTPAPESLPFPATVETIPSRPRPVGAAGALAVVEGARSRTPQPRAPSNPASPTLAAPIPGSTNRRT